MIETITQHVQKHWSKQCATESIYMWEMFLLILIKEEHMYHLSNVQQNFKPTGFGKVFGNKGGLLINFKLYDTLYCFINVHLIHGQKNIVKRNEMMSEVIKAMRTARDDIDPDIMADCCFLIGDLNYRLDTTFTALIKDMANLEKYVDLDQLSYSKNVYKNYVGYREGELAF